MNSDPHLHAEIMIDNNFNLSFEIGKKKKRNLPSAASVFGAAMASSTAVGSRPLKSEREIIELPLWTIEFDYVSDNCSGETRNEKEKRCTERH